MKNTNKTILSVLTLLFAVTYALAGAVVDKDGNKYKTVKIGKQQWMAEDYRYEVRQSVCVNYNDNPDDCVRKYAISRMKFDEWTHICPVGWRLPTLEDVQKLILFFEPNFVNLSQKQQRHASQKMSSKLRSKSWENGEDEYGFNAIPMESFAGSRDANAAIFAAIGPSGFGGKTIYEFTITNNVVFASQTDRLSGRDDYRIRCIEE